MNAHVHARLGPRFWGVLCLGASKCENKPFSCVLGDFSRPVQSRALKLYTHDRLIGDARFGV